LNEGENAVRGGTLYMNVGVANTQN